MEAIPRHLPRNAHDAMPMGGRVTCRQWPPERGLAVVVSDTVRGFKAGALEKVRSGKPSGRRDRLGVGPSLSARPAARLSGRLDIESAKVGSRVVLRLPG